MKNFEYNPTPVVGYGEGVVKALDPKTQGAEQPTRTDNNDWITIGQFRFNVHPFRQDFGGYPVRWIEKVGGGYVHSKEAEEALTDEGYDEGMAQGGDAYNDVMFGESPDY